MKYEIQLYKIIKYLNKRRKRQLIALFLLLIISGLLEAFSIASAIPFLSLLSDPNYFFGMPAVQNISNFLNINSPSQLFFPVTIFFILLILLSTSIRLFNVWFIIFISSRVNIDLNNIIFGRNLYQTYSDYTDKSSAKIISLINQKTAHTTNAISSFLKVTASSIITISIIFSLAIINYKITLYVLLVVSIYYFLISKRVKNTLTKNSKSIAKLEIEKIRITQDSLGGFRDIIINNTQEFYQDIFKKIQFRLFSKKANSEFLIAFPRFIIEALLIISVISLGFYLSKSTEDLQFLALLGTFAYGGQKLLPMIQQIYAGWATYKLKSSSLIYIIDELSTKNNEIKYNYKDKNIKRDFNTFELKNIYFSYKKNNKSNNTIENINLEISKGDFIGIFGKTGSGKSTLLDIITGLLKPNKGKILIDNNDLYKKNELYRWRENLSHVPQNIFLKEGTIEENIIFDRNKKKVNYKLLIEAAKAAHIYEFINETEKGFNTFVGERGIRLSGGQKQRIAIARAIYRRKKILILDEATSAIDEKTERSIIESLKKLDNEMTIIMVTHRQSSLTYCNKIYQIDNGKNKLKNI